MWVWVSECECCVCECEWVCDRVCVRVNHGLLASVHPALHTSFSTQFKHTHTHTTYTHTHSHSLTLTHTAHTHTQTLVIHLHSSSVLALSARSTALANARCAINTSKSSGASKSQPTSPTSSCTCSSWRGAWWLDVDLDKQFLLVCSVHTICTTYLSACACLYYLSLSPVLVCLLKFFRICFHLKMHNKARHLLSLSYTPALDTTVFFHIYLFRIITKTLSSDKAPFHVSVENSSTCSLNCRRFCTRLNTKTITAKPSLRKFSAQICHNYLHHSHKPFLHDAFWIIHSPIRH